MANPVCLSPLMFYDSVSKQNHRKSYAHGNIAPLITEPYKIPSFQFVIPDTTAVSGIQSIQLYDAKTDDVRQAGLLPYLSDAGLRISEFEGYKVVIFNGIMPITILDKEGYFYLEITFNNAERYFSEVFCVVANTSEYAELEYWNESGSFSVEEGVIAFPPNFHFKLLLKTEIGKPEYKYEEESTKRLGYVFIESQVSKKVYNFNTILPEFICDALRLVRLCDNKIIRSKGDEYKAISFEMEADWQTQGDLASVTCSFETDNVIVNFGGFTPEMKGGDFNNDYNNDFKKE